MYWIELNDNLIVSLTATLSTMGKLEYSVLLTSRSLKSIPRKCYFCGEESHPKGRRFYPAKDQTCFKCGKVGHFRRVCRSSPRKRMTTVLPHDDYLNTKEVRDHPEECSSSALLNCFP